jgi:exonuclease SbcD
MKFLHLADLHIGKYIYGFPMLPDQEYILEQILAYVRGEQVQAVVIAGDIYDKPIPSPESVKVFDRFLTALVVAGTAVLAISGNHDSPERLGFASRIMSARQVHLYGVFDGSLHTVTLADGCGDVVFHLLPFLRPSMARRFWPDTPVNSYQDAMRTAIEGADIDWTRRNILIAHQFMFSSGSEPERSESEIGPIGGLDGISAEIVTGFDYVALGHLHGPQNIGGERVRYAGSPLKYSFSESVHQKSVTLVDLGKKGHVQLQMLPLFPLRDMRKLRGLLRDLVNPEIMAQDNQSDYLQVTLTDPGEVIDAMGKLRAVYPNIMRLEFDYAQREPSGGFSAEQLEYAAPLELFAEFFLQQNGADMRGDQVEMVRNLMNEMERKS